MKQPFTKILPLLTLSLLASGAAHAQVFTYFYGDSVQGGPYTDLAALPPTFDNEQYNERTLVTSSGAVLASILSDTTTPGIQGFSSIYTLGTGYGQNHVTPGFTEVIDSITLYAFVDSMSPNPPATATFQLYPGITGRQPGPAVPGTSVTFDKSRENTFISMSIPSSLWAGGFSIGAPGILVPQALWNTATQLAPNPAQRVGFSVNTHLEPVPEPSALLLGVLASTVLFRRRRA